MSQEAPFAEHCSVAFAAAVDGWTLSGQSHDPQLKGSQGRSCRGLALCLQNVVNHLTARGFRKTAEGLAEALLNYCDQTSGMNRLRNICWAVIMPDELLIGYQASLS